jgi:hypothetical protein
VTLRRVRRAELDPIPDDVVFDDREETDHLGRLTDRAVLRRVRRLDRDIERDARDRARTD